MSYYPDFLRSQSTTKQAPKPEAPVARPPVQVISEAELWRKIQENKRSAEEEQRLREISEGLAKLRISGSSQSTS
jgi:hypothetical protein